MANFDDEGGKPVSAVFTAPIPRDSTEGPPTSKEDGEVLEEGVCWCVCVCLLVCCRPVCAVRVGVCLSVWVSVWV